MASEGEQGGRPEATGADGEKVGFWKRVFGGEEGGGEGPAAPEAPSAPTARNRPKPRKTEPTIFDKVEQEQRKRYARAAMMRRERLASAITDKVEQVINDRMETGEEKLARASVAMGEMNHLLGAIGRNLDDQAGQAARMAQTIAKLPEYAEREHSVLETIAANLEGQAASVESVPEVLGLVRQGAEAAHHRLAALQSVHQELVEQRAQQREVLDVLRTSSQRFTEQMSRLEETMATGAMQARNDAQALRSSFAEATDRLVEQGREEARREAQRQAQMLQGLHEVSLRLSESNTLATVSQRTQEQRAVAFHGAHEELVDILQHCQSQTINEMHRIQADVQEREERMAHRNRLALVGSVGFLAVMGGIFGYAFRAPTPTVVAPAAAQAPAVPGAAEEASPREGAGTLPASMPRPEEAAGD